MLTNFVQARFLNFGLIAETHHEAGLMFIQKTNSIEVGIESETLLKF